VCRRSTFLDKLIKSPHWQALVPISVLGFLVCVLTSVPVLFTYASLNYQSPTVGRVTKRWAARAVIAAVSGFLIGILALAIFAVRNL